MDVDMRGEDVLALKIGYSNAVFFIEEKYCAIRLRFQIPLISAPIMNISQSSRQKYTFVLYTKLVIWKYGNHFSVFLHNHNPRNIS
jgi:hypothetical protein